MGWIPVISCFLFRAFIELYSVKFSELKIAETRGQLKVCGLLGPARYHPPAFLPSVAATEEIAQRRVRITDSVTN